MADYFSGAALAAFFKVVMIDVVLAADNAIIVGLAAAGLPPEKRKKAIFWGILAAALLRILFALLTVHLLDIKGLRILGGLLLLWVCWKMWQQLSALNHSETATAHVKSPATFGAAIWTIVFADISMSLDNVLGVAGAAGDHPWIMVFGLAFSVLLMGAAAHAVARLILKQRWIGYLGWAVVVYVAIEMIYRGFLQLF